MRKRSTLATDFKQEINSFWRVLCFLMFFIVSLGAVALDANEDGSSWYKDLIGVSETNKQKKKYTLDGLLSFDPVDDTYRIEQAKFAILTMVWDDTFFKGSSAELARQMLFKFATKSGFDKQSLNIAIAALVHAGTENNHHSRVWTMILMEQNLLSSCETEECRVKSIPSIREAAALGDPLALHLMGHYTMGGDYGVVKNTTKALEYFKQSVEKGGSWGLDALGHFYSQNDENRDMEKAMAYHEQAYLAGSLHALKTLAISYYFDDEVRDIKLSNKYGRELCDIKLTYGATGCALVALSLLEELKENGFKDKNLIKKVVSFAKRGWKQGGGEYSSTAVSSAAVLGYVYITYPEQFNVRPKDIALWAKRGCPERNSGNARIYNLCNSYGGVYFRQDKKGLPIVTDLEAVEYFRRGIREGDPGSYYRLAKIFYFGSANIAKNLKLSYELSSIAAEKYNYPHAIYWLAIHYQKGFYVKQDIEKTMILYKRAALAGHFYSAEYYAQWQNYKKNYKECYVWGSVAKLRQVEDAKIAETCASKLSQSQKVSLQSSITELNNSL